MKQWILFVVILVQFVSSKNICGKGIEIKKGEYDYKDSFVDCETEPTTDNSNNYCLNKFQRKQKSKKAIMVKQKNKYVHKCGHYVIIYKDDDGKNLYHPIIGDYLSIGHSCDNVIQTKKMTYES